MKRTMTILIVIILLLGVYQENIYAVEQNNISSGSIYNIININSNKYLNVHYGVDSNGTNIYQWTKDNSTEQQFKIVYNTLNDTYKLYAMCSSLGINRVVDVQRVGNNINGAINSGANVHLWNATDPGAQEWKIVLVSTGKYKIVLNSNQNLALTSYGTSNGTSSGTSSTSAGNVFVSTYTGANNQLWKFDLVETSYNKYASQYTPQKYNSQYLQNRMNCYGYALQIYYAGVLPYYDFLSQGNTTYYKQQPGEFSNNGEKYSDLMESYSNCWSLWYNAEDFVYDRVCEDFQRLGYTITPTNENSGTISQAPAGKRKIALAVGYFNYLGKAVGDYHFYIQHSDGTWSHKPGASEVTNKSIDDNVILTNSNIAAKGKQGVYTSGIKFYLISKDSVVDYPHSNGHQSSSTYTPTNFKEKAGDDIGKAVVISTGTKSCNIDYSGSSAQYSDKDWFVFTPTTTKTYTITAIGTSSILTYDLDGVIYNSDYSLIASSTSSTASVSLNATLTAGKKYYINIYDYNRNDGASYNITIS